MKLLFSACLLLLTFLGFSQIRLDSIYFDDDSLYAEDLVDAENYIIDESTMHICPVAPTLPGGPDSLFIFIQSKFDSAIISDSESGVVWIGFMIDTSGYFKNVWVFRGISPEIDSACIEIIEGLPRWVPAQDSKGNKVPSWGYMMPFSFKGKVN